MAELFVSARMLRRLRRRQRRVVGLLLFILASVWLALVSSWQVEGQLRVEIDYLVHHNLILAIELEKRRQCQCK
jgi:hypothetical protein